MTLSRRELLLGAGASLAIVALPGRNAWAKAADAEYATKKLYARSLVINMLGALGVIGSSEIGDEALAILAASGVTVVSCTVSVEDFDEAIAGIAELARLVDAHPKRLLLVRQHADLAAAKKSGRVALILNSQGSLLIERELPKLDQLIGLGLRVFQLTYNGGDLVGDGCLEARDAGLTRFGRQLVERLDDQRTAIDVSHCGARTSIEGIQASKRPVLITHSGCNALFAHPRNKDDATLRLMADRGGVLGIYFMPFLGRPTDAGPATTAMVLDHIDHALKVCGADHVGLGTDGTIAAVPQTPEVAKMYADFVESRRKAGIGAPEEERPHYVPELNEPRRLEKVALGMAKRGHKPATIEKVLGKNFQRALGDVWGK